MARGKARADHRADTRGGALSGLPHVVADSAAYLSLDAFDRAVLSEIIRRFNGYNNGSIGITYEQIGDRLKGRNKCRPNNARIAASIVRLINHGLLGEPEPESWLQRRAREYRLTFISSGKGPPFKSPTNDYLRWTASREKNHDDAASPKRRPCGDNRLPQILSTGDAGSPAVPKNGSFPLVEDPVSGDAGSPLIDKPYRGSQNSVGPQLSDKLARARTRARLMATFDAFLALGR